MSEEVPQTNEKPQENIPDNKEEELETGYVGVQTIPVTGMTGMHSSGMIQGSYADEGIIEGGDIAMEGEEMVSGSQIYEGGSLAGFVRSYDKEVINVGYTYGPVKIFRKTFKVPYTDYKIIKVPVRKFRTVKVPYTKYIDKKISVQKFKTYEYIDQVRQKLAVKNVPYERTVTEYRDKQFQKKVMDTKRVPFQKRVVEYRQVPVQKVVTNMVRKPFERIVTDYRMEPYTRVVTEMRRVPYQRKIYQYKRVTELLNEKPKVNRTIRRLDAYEGGEIAGGEIAGGEMIGEEMAGGEVISGGEYATEGMIEGGYSYSGNIMPINANTINSTYFPDAQGTFVSTGVQENKEEEQPKEDEPKVEGQQQ